MYGSKVQCCGPKCSMCCIVISIWGIIMLALLGVFFRIKSVGLLADLPIDATKIDPHNITETMNYIDGLYDTNSTNCFIAAGIYVFWLVVSAICWRINRKRMAIDDAKDS